MFRDSRGVVHTVSAADPLDDVPLDAVSALQSALLRPVDGDVASALERCDAVRDLVERWQAAFFASLPDAVDVAEERRWAAAAGMSLDDIDADCMEAEPDVDEDDEDDLLSADPLLAADDPRSLLPDELVSVLERELLLLPVRTRLEALVAAADLVENWSDLLADIEKLLGHLMLSHGADAAPLDHVALADRHADLHATSGPSHAVAS